MSLKFTPALAALMLLPLSAGNLGSGCSLNTIVPVVPVTPVVVDDSVDVVFVNETLFDVDAIVNDAYFSTVTGNDPNPTEPVSIPCSAGDTITFSGDLVTGGGTFPSPDDLLFNEGTQFFCGDTIEIHYFQDAGGVLRVDGGATGP